MFVLFLSMVLTQYTLEIKQGALRLQINAIGPCILGK